MNFTASLAFWLAIFVVQLLGVSANLGTAISQPVESSTSAPGDISAVGARSVPAPGVRSGAAPGAIFVSTSLPVPAAALSIPASAANWMDPAVRLPPVSNPTPMRRRQAPPIRQPAVAKRSAGPIDIVLLADPNYSIGVAAIINAARKYTSVPVRFWVGFDGDAEVLLAYMQCVGVDASSVTIRRPIDIVSDKALGSLDVAEGKERLRSSANFARFALPQLFPELKVAWYLDTDVLPLADMTLVTAAFARSGKLLRPVIRPGAISKQFPLPAAILTEYRTKYGGVLNLKAPSWNAGTSGQRCYN
jgi:hypothetical protein